MKKLFLSFLFLSLTFCQVTKSATTKYDSFKPGQLWMDNNGVHINAHGGGILFNESNKTYYWYGEHKVEGGRGNSAQVGVHCYSSNDLYNWKDEGIALKVSEDPQSDITIGSVIERPKVIYNAKTKKYVMWFHLELKGQGYAAARTATAVSDTPTGPFTFVESFRPNAGKYPVNVDGMPTDSVRDRFFLRDFQGGQMARDMQLFVDDDGKAYHIASSEENYTMMISLLTDDYRRPSGTFARILVMHQYEGPALFKKDGKYYFFGSGCTGWTPNPGHSAVADHIFGPWKEFGNFAIGEKANTTFESQSTYVLPVQGKKDAFIYLGDRWTPKNAIDGRYIWLPIQWEDGRPVIHWSDEWNLNLFNKK